MFAYLDKSIHVFAIIVLLLAKSRECNQTIDWYFRGIIEGKIYVDHDLDELSIKPIIP
jgi:hypothetical protein